MSHSHSVVHMGKRKAPADDLYSDSRRASGKRYRRKFNPNSWSSSILTIRSNILCLGMSYPSVDKALQEFQLKSNVCVQHSEPSVEQAVELVRRRILSTIDGRDYARIMALEANNDMLAYTVSKEQGGPYEPKRHLNADFNSRTFLEQIKKQWGVGYGREPIKFKQVILDYFWIPPGTWASNHWKQSFFKVNLPDLVYQKLLNYGDLDTDTRYVSVSKGISCGDYVTSNAGVVYLPFCENCFVEVVACSNSLSKVFSISFLAKDELDEHTLWKATNTISADSMQDWLEKKLDQEEEYCKLTRIKLLHGSAIGATTVAKEEVLKVFDRIKNVEDVRMIKLTALRMYHPDYQVGIKWPKGLLGVEKGGYIGLLKKRRSAVFKASTSDAPKPGPIKAPQLRPKQEDFLDKLAVMLSHGNGPVIEIFGSGPIVIKSREQLCRILRCYFDFGDWATFQEQLHISGFRRRQEKTSKNGEQHEIYFNKAKCAKLQSVILARNATLPTSHSLPGHSPQLANLLNDSTIRSIQYYEPGCIEIRDQEQLIQCLPQFFGAGVTWEHFLSELHKCGYEMILCSGGSQFKYVNTSISHRNLTGHEVKSLGKLKADNPIRQISVAADKGVKQSVENIVNGRGIVLHLKNAVYKRIMFDHFRAMIGNKMERNETAQNVLKLLKSAALGNRYANMEDGEGQDSSSPCLFRCDRYQRNIYPISDDEALKMILKDINRRKETASQWMEPRIRRISTRHPSTLCKLTPVIPTALHAASESSHLERRLDSKSLHTPVHSSLLYQSSPVSPSIPPMAILETGQELGKPSTYHATKRGPLRSMRTAVQNTSAANSPETEQDLDARSDPSLMPDQSSEIPLSSILNASNVLDSEQDFSALIAKDESSTPHKSHSMHATEVYEQDCDHRRFKISHQSFLAKATNQTIFKGEDESFRNAANPTLSSSVRVTSSFDKTICEHFFSQISLPTNENKTDSSVDNLTVPKTFTETPFVAVVDGTHSVSDSTLSTETLSETQPNRFAYRSNT